MGNSRSQSGQLPSTSRGFLGRRRTTQHYSDDVKIFVSEITTTAIGRELVRRCGNEGQHPNLDAEGQTTLRFLRGAISFIPIALGDGGNMRNAAFVLVLPGREFLIQSGNGDWEFVFTEGQDGRIYGQRVRSTLLHYIWDALTGIVHRLPLPIVAPALLALAF